MCSCVTVPVNNTLLLCEDDSTELSCADGDEITIVSATYGRTDYYTCPRWLWWLTSNIECTDTEADVTRTDRLKEDCDGEQLCALSATDAFWGGNPCPEAYT